MKNNHAWPLLAILLFFVTSCSTTPDKLLAIRNNWSSYVYCEQFKFRFSSLGGISEFGIPVRNNTDYKIDEVVIDVDYIKKAGGVYKTEQVTVYNIAPHSSKIGKAPESPRGTSVEIKISAIQSRDLNLCLPGNGWDMRDPYKCN